MCGSQVDPQIHNSRLECPTILMTLIIFALSICKQSLTYLLKC